MLKQVLQQIATMRESGNNYIYKYRVIKAGGVTYTVELHAL
jgi:hypothetical protein